MINYKFTNNIDPASAKDLTPIYKVEYTDTPFTVKSSGIELTRYYVTDNNEPDFVGLTNLSYIDTLTTNIIGFYSGDSSLLGLASTERVAFKYSCYFYTESAGIASDYTFVTLGYGKIKVQLRGNWIIGTASAYESLDPLKSVSGASRIKSKNWYRLNVYYYNTTNDSGFSLLWYNSGFGASKMIPVSAGVCSKEGAYLTATEVSEVISVERDYSKGDISSLKFTVPLVVSGSTDPGYYYNSYWDAYCHSTDAIMLDKFKMIEFSSGYKIGTTNNYIKKFCGHIETFNPQRGENNIIEITCLSYENLYKQALNLGYPNLYDYWNAGYAGKFVSESNPDGNGCPVTFDGWELPQVIKVLSIRSGIDPTLFIKKRLYLNASSVILSGTYLIEETSPQPVILDTNLNYGNAVVVTNEEIGSIADDEYIMKSNFGDTLFDYLNTITDVYGWNWGSDSYYDGAPFLKSTNNPKEIYSVKNHGTLGGNVWTKHTDLHTLGGTYYSTNNAGDYVEFSYWGVKTNLAIVCDNQSGAETTVITTTDLVDITVESSTGFALGNVVVIETLVGEESAVIENITGNIISIEDPLTFMPKQGGYFRLATFKAEIRRGSSWGSAAAVQTTYHSCYFNNSYDRLVLPTTVSELKASYLESKRYYYDGIDPVTSVNPTIINLTHGLPYDQYLVRITRLSNTQCGTTNYLHVDSLMIYDNDTNKIVKTFYTGDSVVSGTVVSLNVTDSGEDVRNDTIIVGRRVGVVTPGNSNNNILNPNNPTYEYIISRATDINSIYNPNAKNYTGMLRQTIQIAPEIASYDRAKYWAVNFLNRYRNGGKSPEFETLGHPLMEVDDCIAVYDEGKKTLNTYDKFWITGISDSYEDKNYISSISTTSYEPWESYTPRIMPDIADYDNMIITNLKLTNGGNNVSTWAVGERLPISVYSGGYYDPYSYDHSGIQIALQYDLVEDCYVRIDVYAQERNDILVATLLNPTGEAENSVEGWLRQEPGKRYVVTWDGVDLYGDWNKYCTTNATESIGKGYFAHEGLQPSGVNSSGKFYFKFTILRRNTNAPTTIFSYNTKLLNTTNNPTGFVYIKRSNTGVGRIMSYPRCWFKVAVSGDPGWLEGATYANACFTDSIDYSGTPMCGRLLFSDITKEWASDTSKLPLVDSNVGPFTTRNYQLKITLTPVVFVGASWTEQQFTGYRTQETSKVHDPITIYDNSSFKDYTAGIERYFNMAQFAYSYDNYAYYLGNKSLASMNYNKQIYMAVYMWVEVSAIDKSGRRIFVQCPSATYNHNDYTHNGFWMLWVDDRSPYPTQQSFPSSIPFQGNTSGYAWSGWHNADLGAKLTNAAGEDVIQFLSRKKSDLSYDDTISLIQVYPKKDRWGKDWGY